MLLDNNLKESSVLRQNRRYTKYVQSPSQSSAYFQKSAKSNQQIMWQPQSKLGNNRLSENQVSKSSQSKISSREDSLINYELLVMSHSKNFITDKRKRGRSGFQKKAPDTNQVSDPFFGQAKGAQAHNKVSCPSEPGPSLEPGENEAEEMHYSMVKFQQACKQAVKN